MSRSRSSKNDWRRYKKFEEDNEKLRKEVSKLRRMINSVITDELEKKVQRITRGEAPIMRICDICGNEDLYMVPINRPDGQFEIKVCNSCNHRHPMRKLKNEILK